MTATATLTQASSASVRWKPPAWILSRENCLRLCTNASNQRGRHWRVLLEVIRLVTLDASAMTLPIFRIKSNNFCKFCILLWKKKMLLTSTCTVRNIVCHTSQLYDNTYLFGWLLMLILNRVLGWPFWVIGLITFSISGVQGILPQD